jgi:aspartokinase/homoserine dehydrogenase 1
MEMLGRIVYKFGGSSLADSACMRQAAQLSVEALSESRQIFVVVSAMAGVTDKLAAILELAIRGASFHEALQELFDLHQDCFSQLVRNSSALEEQLKSDLEDLKDILQAVTLIRHAGIELRDMVLGFGELWSSAIMAAFIREQDVDALRFDTRKLICIHEGLVDWEISSQRMKKHETELDKSICIFPGFIASTAEGVPATLGRNGSDYSAAIIAALSSAVRIVIWTDVEGILSADPRLVPEPVFIRQLSYQEAMELAFFGAKVIHPKTMGPAVEKGIPLWIKSTFKPNEPGTEIIPEHSESAENGVHPVKGFSIINQITLLNVEGRGMMGVPGVAKRIFSTLYDRDISVILISQASSEHSICLAVADHSGAQAKDLIEREFEYELNRSQVTKVEANAGLSIIAAVGDQMVHRPGVAARFFGALGKAGINVRAVAQGSSERNISAVIDSEDAQRALQAVHAGFFLSDQTLSIGIIGHGIVGSALLDQLRTQTKILKERFGIDLRVRAITNSRKMVLGENVHVQDWKEELEKSGIPADLEAFSDHIEADHLPHRVIIDCTANEMVAQKYPQWLSKKIHVITPNKKAGAGTIELYKQIQHLGHKINAHFLYEATVGAGLPVITTLRDLIQTGDRVLQIEGVLSGTLSYIFNELSAGASFSDAVVKARNAGFTEPDPREDLSGMDVARKVLILAREMGMEAELKEVKVQSLIPEALQSAHSVEEFLAGLPDFNAQMLEMKEKADAENQVLRYVGIVDPANSKLEVKVAHYHREHPFASLNSSDNIIAFTTERYREQPLIVQGPGAGPEVTAAGVFADLLRLAAYIGTPAARG